VYTLFVDNKSFEKLVEEALDSLPKEFAEKLKNVAVVIEDFPTHQKLQQLGLPPWGLLFGLYEGVPQTKRGIYYSSPPDKITIFKNSIEKVAQTKEQIKAQVKSTVIHEIGHHFGLSDKELQ